MCVLYQKFTQAAAVWWVKSEAYKGLEIIFAIVAFPLAFPELPGAVQAEAYQIPSLRTRLQVFSLYFLSTHDEEIEKACLKIRGPEPCILSRGVLAPPSSTHTTHACTCVNTCVYLHIQSCYTIEWIPPKHSVCGGNVVQWVGCLPSTDKVMVGLSPNAVHAWCAHL